MDRVITLPNLFIRVFSKMKKRLNLNLNKIERIIGFIVFLLLAIFFFSRITYLFRFMWGDRNNIIGIKSEEKNIDVIYIGASSALVYWESLKAYKDYGFTSYSLSVNSFRAESIVPCIKYAEKYQNPQLYIIDLRPFQVYDDNPFEIGIRNTSDAMDISFFPRYELIRTYLNNTNTDGKLDEISYYFDIAKYHTKYDNLKNRLAWEFINNEGESQFKGCLLPVQWAYLETPKDYITDQRTALLPNAQKELDHVLAYCDAQNINVLFVVCPYVITKEHYAIYNSIADQVIAHGYGFLNTNDYYEEMGIDFTNDFYNDNHVNVFGSEKFTGFLEKYIANNYKLPDHRQDVNYVEWNKCYVKFDEYVDQVKKTINEIKGAATTAASQGEEIKKINELSQWSIYVNDSHYSLIMVGNGQSIFTDSYLDQKILKYLGIDTEILFGTDNYIAIITFDEMEKFAMPEIVNSVATASIGQSQKKSKVIIDNRNNCCSIKIDNEEYCRKNFDGINIVVFDNYYRTVLDSITLKKVNGNIIITRD